ncbi:RHS repeat domain-containing protein [Mycolicibacterium confluentis]|uniref:Teneurin-like YD-shell domain-containing protein n=1 Tax=Mycolicibacterium confluentis TaxID=28047 RepID=A0A7I7Y575_9MYCO|nr:RHS repeat-associated core domain-containing protein [Mycolicibacterium confluentis]MCV7319212.1 hypothetical protein [Mycolicibacterium confluentis]ORV24922.1 hypothetical protein AWB99_05420 [Mycolicibacterium confluentis]BBZ36826.1 hypothetical protein MCNF_54310 [Mycolicibacterium confluentis]
MGPLAGAAYQYDDDDQLTSVSSGGHATPLGIPARFDVDPTGRLTGRTLPDGTHETFIFDGSDNLSVDGRWQYQGVLLTDDDRSRYGYDRAGRLTTVSTRRLSRKPEVWHYTWDAWDRLRSVRTPDGQTFEYSYDPLGRRVSKRGSDGGVTEFTWSGTRLVEQVSVDSEARRSVQSWAYLPGELSPQIQVNQDDVDREFFALVTDQVGAPVAMLDPRTGSIAGRSRATVWGTTTWTGAETPWRFPGQYYDEETGLHYNFHRYYHPGVGRYISPDPLGLAPAPNPYSYPVNPTGWVDPLGLNPCQGGPPDVPGPPRTFTPQGVAHSFDRHAHEWYGLPEESMSRKLLPEWQELVERAAQSRKVVEWDAKGLPTYAHLAQVPSPDGTFQFLLVQFNKETGHFVTAFRPNETQLHRFTTLWKTR